jgi:hypothetical protein
MGVASGENVFVSCIIIARTSRRAMRFPLGAEGRRRDPFTPPARALASLGGGA